MEFVQIHNHSHYSLLDGFSSPKALAMEAQRLGYKHLALTDHGTCSGLYNFQKACGEYGLKPILGTEAYICENHENKDKESSTYHLIILAKNEIGYKNLMKLSTESYTKGFYKKARIDLKMLEAHKEGLIVSSACCIGEIPRKIINGDLKGAEDLASRYKDIFKDDFYLEIMTHEYFNNDPQEKVERDLAVEIYKMAKRLNIKAICTQDTHYAKKENWEAQDVMLSMQTIDCVKNPNRMTFNSHDFYLKSALEMENIYSKAPELLANTMEIAEKIQDGKIIVPGQDLLPVLQRPPEFATNEDWLKSLVVDGMKKKGLINKKEYRERIKYEMSVILNCGYVKYFLVLFDLINFASNQNLRVGIGRGSAVSSLVLYVLGVVKIDPIKYDLIFERFLNPDRISPPDVDLDFDYDRRPEIINYFSTKYGADHCCQIGTYNTIKAKAAIRNISKALDIGNDWDDYEKQKIKNPNLKPPKTLKKSLDLGDKFSKMIPFIPTITLEDAYKQEDVFRGAMNRFPKLYSLAKEIEGVCSYGGTHASGLIICKDPVHEHVPLKVSKGIVASQYDGPEVEELGLLKFDILGLKTLTVVDKTVKLIKERHGIDLDVDSLEPDDPKVFKLFYGGYPNMDTRGIFQFESDIMISLLRNMHADRFEDLIVANALNRPGPLRAEVNGVKIPNLYCNYKHGKQKVEYVHPKMGEVLGQTYGIMVFQENIMKVAQVLAGFTGGQADTLRKAVGKKKPELLKQQRDLFVEGCVKNKISKDIAIKIFEQIDFFAGYGFNRSHSAAYAFLAYQTAYLKIHYPLEFMSCLLTSEIGDNDKLNAYIKEAKRMNIVTKGTDINKSGLEFKIEKGFTKEGNKEFEFLRSPFTALKGVGSKAVDDIVKKQPFKSMEDFIRRVDSRVVNKKVVEALITAGAMIEAWRVSKEELLRTYKDIKEQVDKDKKSVEKQKKREAEYEGSIFDEFDFSAEDIKV